MKYAYPLKAHETNSYNIKIKDYRSLTTDDKKILINDFKEFTKYVYWFQNLPHPTRDQLYMSKYVGKCATDFTPRMLQCQRGLAKSLTAQLFVVWLLLRNKNEKIVVISATSKRASSFTRLCLTLLTSIPILNHLEPQSNDRTSGEAFDVAGRIPDDSPSVKAFGATSAKTGSRATMIIYDDVEIPDNSNTAGKREKLIEGVGDVLSLGIANSYRSLCICTPQSSESVYNYMIDNNGYECTIVPSEYIPLNDIPNYKGFLAKHIERVIRQEPNRIGSATDKRCNMKHLVTQQMGQTKAYYKLHYLLDTTLSDAEKYPLKLSDLIVMDLDYEVAPIQIVYSSDKKDCLYEMQTNSMRGDHLFKPKYISSDMMKPYEGIAMFIDPSGRGQDATGYCVTAQLGGRIFLLDADGLKGGYEDETLIKLANIAKLFKVNMIQIESNFGDGSFHQLLKPHLREIYKYGEEKGCAVKDVRASTNKFRRCIENLEPIMNQHKLIVNKNIFIKDKDKKADYSFSHQLTHLTLLGGIKHDDIIDCVSDGVAYWNNSLARSQKDDKDKYRIELLTKALKQRALDKSYRGEMITKSFDPTDNF